MDMNNGTKEILGDIATIGSGVLAWMYASTGKMDAPTVSLTQRFEDAFANTFGQGTAKAIWPTYSGAGNLTPKFTGFLNTTTLGGILLLVADHIAMGIPAYKNKLDGLHNIVEGVGWGVTIGGIVGGIFDPDATQSIGNVANPSIGSSYTGTPGNIPFNRASAIAVGVSPQVV